MQAGLPAHPTHERARARASTPRPFLEACAIPPLLRRASESKRMIAKTSVAGAPLPPTLTAILHEVGRCYAPFMLANDAAVRAGLPDVVAEMDVMAVAGGHHPHRDGAGQRLVWRQPSFKYQSKCLGWLRASHARLPADAMAWVGAVLDGTGCEALLAGATPSRL